MFHFVGPNCNSFPGPWLFTGIPVWTWWCELENTKLKVFLGQLRSWCLSKGHGTHHSPSPHPTKDAEGIRRFSFDLYNWMRLDVEKAAAWALSYINSNMFPTIWSKVKFRWNPGTFANMESNFRDWFASTVLFDFNDLSTVRTCSLWGDEVSRGGSPVQPICQECVTILNQTAPPWNL